MMTIKFNTGLAAFCDPITGNEDLEWEAIECERILREIADKLECGIREGAILDINGNHVGAWRLS